MNNGRYTVIDIGSEETKLLDVVVSSSQLKLLHAERMADMASFIEDGKLTNLMEFVASLKDTMKANDFKCKRLILTSSALGIKSEIVDYANDPKAVEGSFKAKHADDNPALTLVDYQVYNTYITEQHNQIKSVTAQASTYTIESIIRALEDMGFTVVNVVDPITPIWNLMKLYPSSFDVQSRLILNLGHASTTYVAIKDAPIESGTVPTTFWAAIEAILQQVDQPVLKIKALMNRVGLLDDDSRRSELESNGVDPDIYYEIMNEVVAEFKGKLLNILKSFNTLKKYNIQNIIVTGGYADMPGLMEMLQMNTDFVFTRVVINYKHTLPQVHISNKCNQDVGAAYATCIGAILAGSYKDPISLKPKRNIFKVSEDVATKLCSALIAASVVVSLGGGYKSLLNYQENTRLDQVKEETSRLQPVITKLNREVVQKQAYLDALKNVDTLLQPLINYIKSSETETFKIASVDTRNLLMSTTITQDSDLAFLDAEAPAEGDMSGLDAGLTEDVQIKSPMVIRGYALTTDEISAFYSGLQELKFTDSLKMVGIEAVTLPSEEAMYVFEIEIGR